MKFIKALVSTLPPDRTGLVDLRTCKPGDKLRSVHGAILTYVGLSGTPDYPHRVEYPDGGYGTRTDDGLTFRRNRMDTDHDIVEIIPSK